MQSKTVVIRVQTLSGAWETLGADRARGVWPENVVLSSNAWGPDKASFSLHRDPGMMWPDLGAFTPVKVEVGGLLRWSGRISETPTSQSSRVINVQCEGWQYHLDDDSYAWSYLHTKLGDYKDQRGVPGATLGSGALNAAGACTVDGAGIYLGWPSGTTLAVGTGIAAVLDLGAACAKRVVVSIESANASPDLTFYVIGADYPGNSYIAGTYDTAVSIVQNTGAQVSTAGTFATARRYVHVVLVSTSLAAPIGQDHWCKVAGCAVFADTAYESALASLLNATDIIPDALDRATMLLSDDRSQIDPNATVTFAFPEFALDGQKTARDVLSAANAVHDYSLKIDESRRLIFKPKASAALIEIGEWPGSSFDDASANSGDEIYNRVVVEGTAADGEKLSLSRSASQQPGVVGEPVTSPAPGNPSFVTNTATWTASTGSAITRDTVTFDTSPAAGRWDRGGGGLGAGDTLTETFTGTFRAGVAYTFLVSVRASVPGMGIPMTVGVQGVDTASASGSADTSWSVKSVTWIPTADRTGVTLVFQLVGISRTYGAGIQYVDSVAIFAAQPTLVDRRGFKRTHTLPIKNTLTTELATQIGDVWLAAHKTTPLKGTVRIEGDAATREILTGRSVPPDELLTRTGELLRLSDRVDPDTGGQGRKGRIADVSYNASEDVAVVSLDSRRTSHEALLERLAVVVGSS